MGDEQTRLMGPRRESRAAGPARQSSSVAQVNFADADFFNYTAIHLAASKGFEPVVQARKPRATREGELSETPSARCSDIRGKEKKRGKRKRRGKKKGEKKRKDNYKKKKDS